MIVGVAFAVVLVVLAIKAYEKLAWHSLLTRSRKAQLTAHRDEPVYLILANPISGDGKARRIYEEIVAPMLKRAGIRSKLALTQFAGHARKIASKLDSESVDALILISGDGMVHEVMQGLAEKCGGDTTKLRELYHKVPLGLVPGGSSNGLAASFGNFDVVQACIGIINGKPHPLDVQEIDLGSEGPKLWDAHAFCFGIFADHDRLVENDLRNLGVAFKGIVAPVAVIAKRREYKCRVEFLPGEAPGSKGYNDAHALPEVQGSEGWRRLEGTFIAVNIFNTAWAASDVHICPFAERSGGAVDISIIRGGPFVSRIALIRAFLGFGDASHLKLPFFEQYRAEKWRLIPNMDDIGRTTLDLSGEQFDLSPASAVVHHGMARVLAVK